MQKMAILKIINWHMVYKVHPNVNIYGAGTAIRTNDTELGFQAGVIGHVPLTE